MGDNDADDISRDTMPRVDLNPIALANRQRQEEEAAIQF